MQYKYFNRMQWDVSTKISVFQGMLMLVSPLAWNTSPGWLLPHLMRLPKPHGCTHNLQAPAGREAGQWQQSAQNWAASYLALSVGGPHSSLAPGKSAEMLREGCRLLPSLSMAGKAQEQISHAPWMHLSDVVQSHVPGAVPLILLRWVETSTEL